MAKNEIIEEDLSPSALEKLEEQKGYHESDIYKEYSDKKRNLLLLIVAGITFLLPLSDTIYLPSLPTITSDLDTSYSKVSLTVALYTIAIGILPLLWGPLADFIGRKKTAIISLIIFEASCVGCLLAPEINSLIVFRIIQGIGIAAVLIVATSTITDTWTPDKRGLALGLCAVPLLVGPVIGPVIGGIIANAWSWRATFVVLLIIGGLAIITAIFVFQETLPYHVFETKVKKEQPQAINPFEKPSFLAPWKPLQFYAIPSVAILSLGMGLCFTGFFVLMVILPDVLSQDYGLNQVNTGLCFLPLGFGALIGSPLGGKLADIASKKYQNPAGTLFVANLTLILMIPVLIANGWYMEEKGPLAGLLVLNACAGFCQSFAMPGIQAYAVTIIPSQAGAIIGLIQLIMFAFAGILIFLSTILADLMGYGWLFTAIALIEIFSASAVVWLTWKKLYKETD